MAGNNDRFVNQIADIKADYTKWYTDVCLKSELCDYGPVKGTMIFRPYGYAIWELIQAEADKRFKARGGTRRGVCARSRYRYARRQRRACRKAGASPDVRNDYRQHVFQVDRILPRSSVKAQSVG